MTGRYREIISESEHQLAGVLETLINGNPSGRSEFWVDTPHHYARCWDATHPGPPYVTGGGLTIFKGGAPNVYVQHKGEYIGSDYRPGLNIYSHYTGGFWPNSYGSMTIPSSDIANMGLSGTYGPSYGAGLSYGSAAYNRFKPKINSADLGQTLGEIRETLPMLKTTARGYHDFWKSLGGSKDVFGPKSVADHFLNHSFGWVPFLRDMVNTYITYKTTADKLRRLRQNNGKWSMHGGTVEQIQSQGEFSTREDMAGYVYPALPTAFFDPTAAAAGKGVSSTCHTEYYSKVWFEGRFRYYIPWLGEDDTTYKQIVNRVQLYGARVSPTLIWKVTPWTWLADWVTNAGDVISNAEDNFFGLASLYAYVMRHTYYRVVNSSTIRLKAGPVNCVWFQEVVTKTRNGASHFGFGLDELDFNNSQIAILAALGVSRA